jgi:hypothetical protein
VSVQRSEGNELMTLLACLLPCLLACLLVRSPSHESKLIEGIVKGSVKRFRSIFIRQVMIRDSERE